MCCAPRCIFGVCLMLGGVAPRSWAQSRTSPHSAGRNWSGYRGVDEDPGYPSLVLCSEAAPHPAARSRKSQLGGLGGLEDDDEESSGWHQLGPVTPPIQGANSQIRRGAPLNKYKPHTINALSDFIGNPETVLPSP